MRTRSLTALVFSLGLALSSAFGQTVEERPPLRVEPHAFEAANGEVVAAERGYLTVPANRQRPESGTIELAFVRFRSTASRPGSPIVYLAGGPGGSGIGAARGSRFALFMALRDVADVIAFDQRGTGLSEPFNLCPERVEMPLDQPTDPGALTRELRRRIAACRDRLRANGADLAGLTTEESADDLDALRRALGEEKISLWGISYGTHLALATLRRHGGDVDRAILAGVEGPDHTLKPPSQQQALLEEIAARVRRDPELAEAIPDLLALMERVLTRVGKAPISVPLTDPRTGDVETVVAGRWDLQFATAQMLRGPESFAALPALYWRLDRGDDLALALLRAGFSTLPIGRAMAHVMDCVSGASQERRARIAREADETLLGDAINLPPVFDSCDAWQVPAASDDFRSDVESSVPTLFISGTLDGRTPPENADEVLRGFENAVHLVLDGAGHSDPLFLSSPEIRDRMLDFLHGRAVADQRMELPPPRFVVPRMPIELPGEVLERYVGRYRLGGGEQRQFLRAGALLYSRRGTGAPLPLRPFSETEFFFEGSGATAEFHLRADGLVEAVSVTQDDGGTERAEKLD